MFPVHGGRVDRNGRIKQHHATPIVRRYRLVRCGGERNGTASETVTQPNNDFVSFAIV